MFTLKMAKELISKYDYMTLKMAKELISKYDYMTSN